MTAVYLAAPFGQRDRLLRYAAQLSAKGHIVTSRWLTQEKAGPLASADLVRYARKDMRDILRSELVIFFTPQGKARGGVHVEFGFALAMKKRLVVIGPRSTIFHNLPEVVHFDNWKSTRAFIGVA